MTIIEPASTCCFLSSASVAEWSKAIGSRSIPERGTGSNPVGCNYLLSVDGKSRFRLFNQYQFFCVTVQRHIGGCHPRPMATSAPWGATYRGWSPMLSTLMPFARLSPPHTKPPYSPVNFSTCTCAAWPQTPMPTSRASSTLRGF